MVSMFLPFLPHRELRRHRACLSCFELVHRRLAWYVHDLCIFSMDSLNIPSSLSYHDLIFVFWKSYHLCSIEAVAQYNTAFGTPCTFYCRLLTIIIPHPLARSTVVTPIPPLFPLVPSRSALKLLVGCIESWYTPKVVWYFVVCFISLVVCAVAAIWMLSWAL